MKRTTKLKTRKALRSRKALPKMSAKQRKKLAAKGIVNPSTTFAPVKLATSVAKRPADTGFDAATTEAILERDGWSCGRCGGALHGVRGFDYSIQHRRARGMGGTDRPDTNAPQNGLALCGSATSAGGCHQHVEAHPEEAEQDGYRVPQDGDPLMFPVVHALHGPGTFLYSNGSRGSRPEEV